MYWLVIREKNEWRAEPANFRIAQAEKYSLARHDADFEAPTPVVRDNPEDQFRVEAAYFRECLSKPERLPDNHWVYFKVEQGGWWTKPEPLPAPNAEK
jgi:hypothetical protein